MEMLTLFVLVYTTCVEWNETRYGFFYEWRQKLVVVLYGWNVGKENEIKYANFGSF